MLIKSICLSLVLVIQTVVSKPSTPKDGCQKTEIVPSDGSIKDCTDFIEKYNITFDQLLEWNDGLHKSCDNLDMGNKMCILGPKPDDPSNNVPPAPAKDATTISDPLKAHHKEKKPKHQQPKDESKPEQETPQLQSTRMLYPDLVQAFAANPETFGSSAESMSPLSLF